MTTEDLWKAVYTAYENGMTTQEIMKQFSIGATAARRIRAAHGKPKANGSPTLRSVSASCADLSRKYWKVPPGLRVRRNVPITSIIIRATAAS